MLEELITGVLTVIIIFVIILRTLIMVFESFDNITNNDNNNIDYRNINLKKFFYSFTKKSI